MYQYARDHQRNAGKKSNITSQAECFDYEAFAPQLQRNPCIWDLHDENYNLAEYRGLAFWKIEKSLQLKCECDVIHCNLTCKKP